MEKYPKNQSVETIFLIPEIEEKIKAAKELETEAWKAGATLTAYKQIGIKEGLKFTIELINKFKR